MFPKNPQGEQVLRRIMPLHAAIIHVSQRKVALQCSKHELFEIRPKRGNRVQIIRENLKESKEKEN
jgi:hypothetical protein